MKLFCREIANELHNTNTIGISSHFKQVGLSKRVEREVRHGSEVTLGFIDPH